ncbi:MAG: cobalt transporter [Alphaproteobacteria bacterium]|nr:cobalt transporter [Alphaproteobacteria bacterium]
MLWRMVQTGLFAGFLTALIYSVVQALTVTPLIFEAEVYEQAGGGHSHGPTVHLHEDGQSHLHQEGAAAEAPIAEPAEPWSPADGIERYGFTVLANIVTAVGFSLVMAAAFAVWGKPVDMRAGLWWGVAGYVIFALAPSLGLPPEVPGAAAAPLEARQTWWFGTMGATALGLGLLVFAKPLWLRLIGLPILLVPHLIGAPHPVGLEPGPVPPELASLYVVWALVTALIFWLLLGASAGEIYRRLGDAAARAAERRVM